MRQKRIRSTDRTGGKRSGAQEYHKSKSETRHNSNTLQNGEGT
jgi:hypothetical protein